MQKQLRITEVEAKGGPRTARHQPRRGLIRTTLYWAPVWLAGILFAQLALLGMRPARREQARLEVETARMDARVATLLSERHEIACDLRRLADEIFRERVRRSGRHGRPLTLQAARALTRPQARQGQ